MTKATKKCKNPGCGSVFIGKTGDDFCCNKCFEVFWKHRSMSEAELARGYGGDFCLAEHGISLSEVDWEGPELAEAEAIFSHAEPRDAA